MTTRKLTARGYSNLQIRKQQAARSDLDAIAKRILQTLEDGSIRGDANLFMQSKSGQDWVCSVREFKLVLQQILDSPRSLASAGDVHNSTPTTRSGK